MADLDAIFKAYDVRGVYPEQIDESVARGVGNAFVGFTGAARVLVGRDARPSSEPLVAAFVDGATLAGAEVVDLGIASTDLVYFASGALDAPGAMFTASHNPAQYNGIKLCRAGAAPVGIGDELHGNEADRRQVRVIVGIGVIVDVRHPTSRSQSDPEVVEHRGFHEERLDGRVQPAQHLFDQIARHQTVAAGDRVTGGAVAQRHRRHDHPGRPALTAVDHQRGRGAVGSTDGVEGRLRFSGRQFQLFGTNLEHAALQSAPRQIQRWRRPADQRQRRRRRSQLHQGTQGLDGRVVRQLMNIVQHHDNWPSGLQC